MKAYFVGTHSNEYPQHMFSWRNKKNINKYILVEKICLKIPSAIGLVDIVYSDMSVVALMSCADF